MRYIEYEKKKLAPATRKRLAAARRIIEEYADQGYVLTLRQLYYQFVARGLLENSDRQYKALGNAIGNGRLAGLIPWDAIVDRARVFKRYGTHASPAAMVDECAWQYMRDLWERQPYYVEVWVEKQALEDVVAKGCEERRVPHFACKGYVSLSAMWQAAQRIARQTANGKQAVIIHLGDHDPSGMHMTKDIRNRLCKTFNVKVKVDRIALNMAQIRQYNPPPNPAKLNDPRSDGYVKRFGEVSWELDALEPSVITSLVAQTIDRYVDLPRWEKALAQEESDKYALRDAADQLRG